MSEDFDHNLEDLRDEIIQEVGEEQNRRLDVFAAAALTGIYFRLVGPHYLESMESVAKQCFAQAAAMVEESEKWRRE